MSDSAERLAAAVLEVCGIDPAPPIALPALADALGVSEIRSASMVEDGRLEQRGGRTVIYLREQAGPQRRRFTLAHELGHLVLAEPGRDFVAHRREVHFDSEERFCNQFAAALLLPRHWVSDEFGRAPVHLWAARRLAARAETSLSAALVRLQEVLDWQASMLHWRRLAGQWRLVSTAGLPRAAHNRVVSTPQTRLVLDSLVGRGGEQRGILPLQVGGEAHGVPVEIRVGRQSATALAFFTDLRVPAKG
jgi:IrrE N-terminal-like domain